MDGYVWGFIFRHDRCLSGVSTTDFCRGYRRERVIGTRLLVNGIYEKWKQKRGLATALHLYVWCGILLLVKVAKNCPAKTYIKTTRVSFFYTMLFIALCVC